MNKKLLFYRIPLLLALSLSLLPEQSARADTGPKPSMDFSLFYEIDPVPILLTAQLLECSTQDCSDAQPLPEMGPQGFSCFENHCSSLAYGYSDYHRLSIEFSDGVLRQSNVFTKQHFQAEYMVRVLPDRLQVDETGGSSAIPSLGGMGLYLLARSFVNPGLLVTLGVELFVGLVYALWRKRPWLRVLLTTLLMNLLTQPILWLLVKEMRLATCAGTYLLELAVVLLEAWILQRVLRKRLPYLKYSECFWLSLVMNALSFGVGLLLPL